ncbi:MAG: hypothetical protein FIB08_05895 [Candidatus Methanoperedens sp.]|nr:hypothetical protein [Candidatus Methanoperedens sp.]
MDLNDPQVRLAVYILYGTSFIMMFLAILMWRERVSHIEFMKDFLYLGIFGLLHGLAEYSDIPRFLEWQPAWAFDFIKLILVSSSFAALLAFGLSIVSAGIEERRWLHGIALGALFMFFWMLIFLGFINRDIQIYYKDAYNAIDLAQRYSLGFIGALISSYAFFDLSKKMESIVGGRAGIRFSVAGIGFALYAILGGLIVTSVFGIPVVVFRSITALLITIAVIWIFRLFELKPGDIRQEGKIPKNQEFS